jgi:hypothetical protein
MSTNNVKQVVTAGGGGERERAEARAASEVNGANEVSGSNGAGAEQ